MRRISVLLATLLVVGCGGPAVMAPINAQTAGMQAVIQALQTASDQPTVDPAALLAIDDAESRGGKPDGDLDRFLKVDDGVFRGARPSDKGLSMLKDQGFRTVINLENDKPAIAHERAAAAALGLNAISLPMSAITVPSLKTAQTFLKLTTDPANQPVYFHCTWGRDRTGTMAFVYRISVNHWTYEKAYAEMVRVGFRRSLLGLNAFVKWYGWKYGAKTAPLSPVIIAH